MRGNNDSLVLTRDTCTLPRAAVRGSMCPTSRSDVAMSIATGVTTRCSRARAQVMRQGRHLAADAVDTYRAGALLLRGSPFAVGWFAGWLSAQFSPQVVTGQALSRVTHPSVGRVATTWAAQRADQILAAALEESFGSHYRDMVCHPITDTLGCARRGGLLQVAGHRRRYGGTDVKHRLRPGRSRQPAGHVASARSSEAGSCAGDRAGARRSMGGQR
jgi:hypothetical protein